MFLLWAKASHRQCYSEKFGSRTSGRQSRATLKCPLRKRRKPCGRWGCRESLGDNKFSPRRRAASAARLRSLERCVSRRSVPPCAHTHHDPNQIRVLHTHRIQSPPIEGYSLSWQSPVSKWSSGSLRTSRASYLRASHRCHASLLSHPSAPIPGGNPAPEPPSYSAGGPSVHAIHPPWPKPHPGGNTGAPSGNRPLFPRQTVVQAVRRERYQATLAKSRLNRRGQGHALLYCGHLQSWPSCTVRASKEQSSAISIKFWPKWAIPWKRGNPRGQPCPSFGRGFLTASKKCAIPRPALTATPAACRSFFSPT